MSGPGPMSAPGLDPEIVERAGASQRLAADPAASVFVEANAGSGKTRVLVDRVARLLLAGARPDRMLCVTFTKAAAGEMQTRLFRKLGRWSTLDDAALSEELDALTGGTERPDLAEARRLFARALETPGGLRIQTLHAFCEALLRRFPLEAGLPPGFSVQDDAASAALREEALDAVLARAAAEPHGPRARAIATLLAACGAEALTTLGAFAAQHRHALLERLAEAGSADILADRASLALDVAPDLDEDGALEQVWEETATDDLEAALSALKSGDTATARSSAAGLFEVLEAGQRDPAEAGRLYLDWITTSSGSVKAPRTIYPAKLGQTYRILVTLFGDEGSERHRVTDEALPLVAAGKANSVTRAAIALTAEILSEHQTRLDRRRLVEFSDLVDRARRLLTDSEARAWALYKLDQGLDHVLVDEAQDTAPEQWAVVNAITAEFFAGAGARDPGPGGLARTVFCVGDEKQSIYSFQNADPAEFLAQRLKLSREADGAGARFESPALAVSFRSAPEVLEAVDLAFAAEAAAVSDTPLAPPPDALETKFLMRDPDTGRPRDALPFHRYDGHQAARANTPGCVELWPAVLKPNMPDMEELDLRPVDAERKDSARNQLAEAVAADIAGLLERGDAVWEEGRPFHRRPARAGDVIVLVRKRGGLFEEIIRRLKLNGVPVAGADRMTLPDQLVVEDLLSLARFALLPEDDLSLAEVLKSPFFHPAGAPAPVIDDDALFDLSRQPGRRLWDKLRHCPDARFTEARAALEAARARVDSEAPYGFFARFLGEASATGESRLARLYARLGEEARDPAEEFLSRALAHEREGAPSLARFVAQAVADSAQIKRETDSGRDEVRVMTVHGAKGLEAPIVFLPDTTQIGRDRSGGLHPHPESGLVWAPDSSALPRLVEDMKAQAQLKADAEYQRLFYVAMTRARDRLVICGHTHGSAGRIDAGCWLDRAQRAFRGPNWRPIRTPLDAVARRNDWEAPPGLRFGPDPEPLGRAGAAERPGASAPDWVRAAPPEEPAALRMAAPSRLLDEDGAFEPVSLSPLAAGGPDRFRRGALIHKLLQTLPDLPPERRAASAARYLDAQPDLDPARRAEIAAETLRVITDPDFAALFGPGSRAEVAVSGRAPGLPEGLVINGQIDRLVVTDHEILIVDYKTNRPPPDRAEDVPETYVVQMAAYRALLEVLHPGKPVRCALLWTDLPRLMALPDARLNAALARIGRRGPA